MIQKMPVAHRIGVIYARYSSHNQNDASIEQQVCECMEYAQANGIDIIGTFADRAVSGRTDRRPEFQRMMRQAKTGHFNTVLAYKSNRIARNMMDALVYEDKLSKLNVDVVYCKEEFGNNATGRFMLRTMMNMNQFYSENMSEDITRGMIDRAKQCKINGAPPFGYRKGADDRLEIDPEQADAVREIFARVADGDSMAAIADDFNARCIRTGAGQKWTRSSFSTIIRNERYLGIYIYGDVRIPDGMPRILDDTTFARVQRILEDRGAVKGRRRGVGTYLLTGRLYCGLCGAPMTGRSGTSCHGATYYYYECSRKARHHACTKRAIRRDAADNMVIGALCNTVLGDMDLRQWMVQAALQEQEARRAVSPVPRFRAEIADIDAAIGNILKAIESGIFNASVNARLNELEGRRAELQARIRAEEAQHVEVGADDIAAWLDSFSTGRADDPEFRRRLARTFLSRAYLYDDTLTLIFAYTQSPDMAETLEGVRARMLEWDSAHGAGYGDGPSPGLCSLCGGAGVPNNAGANTLYRWRLDQNVYVVHLKALIPRW